MSNQADTLLRVCKCLSTWANMFPMLAQVKRCPKPPKLVKISVALVVLLGCAQAGAQLSGVYQDLYISGQLVPPNPGHWSYAYCTLADGTLSSSSMRLIAAYFDQSGGTNSTGGLCVLGAEYTLSGGTLRTGGTGVESFPPISRPPFVQIGGVHIVTNTLSIYRWPYWDYYSPDYCLGGGQLVVSNMFVAPQAHFSQTGGTLAITGTLTMANCDFWVGPGAQRFGYLQITNVATLHMPGSACRLHFRNSSGVAWSSDAQLIIDGWIADGTQHIAFGTNSLALTASQVNQIRFRDPVGVQRGIYPAQILKTGELVPAGLFFSATNSTMTLKWFVPSVLQSASDVRGPYADVLAAQSPYAVPASGNPNAFFRLKR